MKDLVLYGAGGMGRETAILVGAINEQAPTYKLLGYVVDEEYYKPDTKVNGLPLLGDRKWLIDHKEQVVCTCAIGRPKSRLKIMEELTEEGVKFETLISPDVYIDPSVEVGPGTIIQTRCLVAVNVKIGKGVFLNTDVTLGHDNELSDYVVCNPRVQISGGCKIGKAAMLGGMSFVNEHVKIGEYAVAVPGSIMLRNVKPHTYVMGNPAKKIEL